MHKEFTKTELLAEVAIRLLKVSGVILTAIPDVDTNRMRSMYKYYSFVSCSCEIFIALNEYLSRCNASLSIALSL